jgi:hypothetical protein
MPSKTGHWKGLIRLLKNVLKPSAIERRTIWTMDWHRREGGERSYSWVKKQPQAGGLIKRSSPEGQSHLPCMAGFKIPLFPRALRLVCSHGHKLGQAVVMRSTTSGKTPDSAPGDLPNTSG